VDRFSRRYGFKIAAALGAMAATGKLESIAFAEKVPVGDAVDGSEATVGGDLLVRAAELGDNMDPGKTSSLQSGITLRLVGDTLIGKDFDGNFVPYLASSWDISEDGLDWTFHLRDGVTFHDGTPLDAEAVRYTFARLFDENFAAGQAKAQLGTLIPDSLAAPDATTFTFSLSAPFAPLLQFLTQSSLSIVSPTAAQADPEGFARKPVLSGSYIFDEWREGDRVILKRNPDYAWAPEYLHQEPAGAFIETITFQSIIEEAAATAAFEAGEVQQLPVPKPDIQRLQDEDQYNMISYDVQGISFFSWNITHAPFDDKDLRFALMGAADKESFVEAGLEGFGKPAYTYMSPAQPMWDADSPNYAPPYDPDAVKAKLAELGWADSDGDGILEKDGVKLSFTALSTSDDFVVRVAQVLQANFADVGCHMELQQLEFATLLDTVSRAEHEAAFIGYSYPDPDFAFQLFHSSQLKSVNFPQVNDPALDALIEKQRSEMDPAVRATDCAELQRYINDQALIIPLYVQTSYIAYSKSLKGAAFHPDTYTVYYDAYLAD
jgi:peptide/nickel transport system substrate-binding protein